MDNAALINILTVLVLLALLVASVYLIYTLYRANKILNRFDGLSETFRSFVADIVPAIVNVGTIAAAVEAIVRRLHLPPTPAPRSVKAKK